MRSSDASDDRLKTLPPAPTQLGAQAPGLKSLPSLLRQVLLPSTDRGAQGRGGRLGGGRWGRGCRRRGHEDPPRCGGLPTLGRRPHGYQSGRDNTARPSPRLPLGGRRPDPGDRDPPAPARQGRLTTHLLGGPGARLPCRAQGGTAQGQPHRDRCRRRRRPDRHGDHPPRHWGPGPCTGVYGQTTPTPSNMGCTSH